MKMGCSGRPLPAAFALVLWAASPGLEPYRLLAQTVNPAGAAAESAAGSAAGVAAVSNIPPVPGSLASLEPIQVLAFSPTLLPIADTALTVQGSAARTAMLSYQKPAVLPEKMPTVGHAARPAKTPADIPATMARDTFDLIGELGVQEAGEEGSGAAPSSARGRALFDGAKRRAPEAAAKAAARPAAEFLGTSLHETGLTASPALDPGRTSSGLAPPALAGVKPFSEYRAPRGLRFQLAASKILSATLACVAIAPFLYTLGPVLAAGALAVSSIPWVLPQRSYFGRMSLTEPSAPEFRAFIEETVRMLWLRLGSAPESMPWTIRYYPLDSEYTLEATASEKRIIIGEGYALLPAEQTTAVLAHELGHLLFRDAYSLAHWPGSDAGRKAMKSLLILFPSGVLGGMLASVMGLLSPASLLLLFALPLIFLAAQCFLFAAQRQMEMRADHFSAWLTNPVWLAGFFQDLMAPRAKAGPTKRLVDAVDRSLDWLTSTHPSREARIRMFFDYGRGAAPVQARRPLKARLWEYADSSAVTLVFAVGSGFAYGLLGATAAFPLALAALWAANAAAMRAQLSSLRSVVVGGWQASHDQRYRVGPDGRLRDVRGNKYGSDRYEEHAPGTVSRGEWHAVQIVSTGLGLAALWLSGAGTAYYLTYLLASAGLYAAAAAYRRLRPGALPPEMVLNEVSKPPAVPASPSHP